MADLAHDAHAPGRDYRNQLSVTFNGEDLGLVVLGSDGTRARQFGHEVMQHIQRREGIEGIPGADVGNSYSIQHTVRVSTHEEKAKFNKTWSATLHLIQQIDVQSFPRQEPTEDIMEPPIRGWAAIREEFTDRRSVGASELDVIEMDFQQADAFDPEELEATFTEPETSVQLVAIRNVNRSNKTAFQTTAFYALVQSKLIKIPAPGFWFLQDAPKQPSHCDSIDA